MPDYLFHFSDFHFGENIYDEGNVSKKTHLRDIIRHPIKYASGEFPLQSHTLEVLKNLPNSIKIITKEKNIKPDDIIGHVITGDISTCASPKDTFNNFQYKYLTDEVLYNGLRLGLKIQDSSLICVIGNHDKIRNIHASPYIDSHFGDRLSNRVNSQTGKLDYIIRIPSLITIIFTFFSVLIQIDMLMALWQKVKYLGNRLNGF